MLSGRRTYIDVLLKPFISKSKFDGSGYYFYDLNAKANYTFSDKDRVFLSGYFGRDVFSFKNDDIKLSIPWGNATATVRWNHLFNDRLFMNLDAIYNDYHFELGATQNDFEINMYSGIKDRSAKIDFSYYPHIKHEIKFGVNTTYHIFLPSSITGRSGDVEFNPQRIERKYGYESGVFLQDKYTFSDMIEVNAGLRVSMFEQVGPYKKVFIGFSGFPEDSIFYKNSEHIKTYYGVEPRLILKVSVGKHASIKTSYNLSKQYLHLVSNNGTTLPTDIWVPSSIVVKPQIGDQYSLGYFRNFIGDKIETSVEIYYKTLKNQIEFREGYTPTPNEDIEDNFCFRNWRFKGN